MSVCTVDADVSQRRHSLYQVSLQQSFNPLTHLQLGQALASLDQEVC